MFKQLKNEKGIALIMVLIMLVVVGGLSAALLVSSRGHVRTAVHEQDMSQAFHSAEAGVEYVMANIDDVIKELRLEELKNQNELDEDEEEELEDLEDTINNGNIIINGNTIEYSNIRFNILLDDLDNYTLISEGTFEGSEYSKRIKFNFDFGGDLSNFNIVDRNRDEYHKYAGNAEIQEPTIVDNKWDDFDDFYNYFVDTEGYGNDWDDNLGFKDEYIGETGVVNGSLGSVHIEDSVLVIRGSLGGTGNKKDVTIRNSTVIVKDWVQAVGVSSIDKDEDGNSWSDPLVFIYGENSIQGQDLYLDISGTGGFSINFREVDDNVNIPKTISNWQQL